MEEVALTSTSNVASFSTNIYMETKLLIDGMFVFENLPPTYTNFQSDYGIGESSVTSIL